MTDLQKLARWHDRHSKARPEQSAHAKKYAETARILSVLLRVREGCAIEHINEFAELTGLEIYSETCPERTLRDLDELLGGGK